VGGLHAHPATSPGTLEETSAGLRAIKISGGVLAASAVLRLSVAAISGSVGLLAAGLDDLGDVLTTIALLIAFVASARAATRRYTFGYQRLEDLAGVLVVLVIWSSVVFASIQAARKLAGHHEVTDLGIAMGAALLGLLANGAIGMYKIRVGRRISSPPLVADGKHALTDALASVVAFGGLIGVRAGFPQADPIAAFVVVLAIAAVGVDAGRNVLTRLIDAVDPEIIHQIEHAAEATEGVADVGRVQARWAGRSLYVTLTVAVDPSLPVAKAHDIAEAIHHHILHDVPGVAQVDVHVDPGEAHGEGAHRRTTAHDDAASEKA
jgi:cation diffusion facilitator family transporter